MIKGASLHLGLNYVDPKHYDGWDGKLAACENDANDMEQLAKGNNFTTTKLYRAAVTRNAVKNNIDAAAASLQAGDIFFLTYSGHGGQVPDKKKEEDDNADETWCLFDGEMLDDEINVLLGNFKKGVRILVLSDSCHSGTVIRDIPSAAQYAKQGRIRAMPTDVAKKTYEKNKEFYDSIRKDKQLKTARNNVQASVLLISGCQDDQYSMDGDKNGAFTEALLKVWSKGKFQKNYRAFHEAIVEKLPEDQTPNYFTIGMPNEDFESQVPFTV